jgi:hypothetical protein
MLLKSKNNILLPLLLVLITILTRIPFTSKILSHWDSVQFTLATERYDITVHQPHPPGYFLYVMLGKFFNLFTGDANMSFITMSIIASSLTVFFVFLMAREMYDTKTAFWSSVLAITSPLLWFHGEVALTYIFDAFFSVFFAFLCWKILNGQYRLIFISALVLAFIGGIRQSTLVFLIPLWLYSIRKSPYKYIIISFALLVTGILSWFLPMLSMTGGYERYKAAVDEHWAYTMYPSAVINGGLKSLINNLKDIIQFTIYGLGLSIAFDAFYLIKSGFKDVKSLSSRKGIFISLWILPAILFYLLVYIGGYGYCLIFMPALLILSVKAFNCLAEKSSYPQKTFAIIIFLTITFNLYYFFYTNSPASIYILKRNYTDTMDFVRAVRGKLSSSDTVILSYDYQFRGPRHFMYYMPEYKVYIMDNRVDMHGRRRRIFWGQNRNTFVSDKVYIPEGIKYFVSPINDKNFLTEMKKAGEKINILSMGEKDIAFYGDIGLAPKAYSGIKFVIGNN